VRTAIISDIHGNAVGFEAVLAHIETEPVDQVVCLGDVAQGGAQPAECLELLRALECPVVMGNSDAFVLDLDLVADSPEPITGRHLEIRAWTLDQLKPKQLEFMRSFSPTIEADLGGDRRLLGFHGSPRSWDDVLLPETPDDEFARAIGDSQATALAGGHVHFQWLRRYGDAVFLNPGSAGLAYDRAQSEDDFRLDPWAEYAVITVEDTSIGVEFRRIPFDPGEVVRATLESAMPHAEQRTREWRG
jgi:predicted phosphodiesterase